MNFSIKVFVDKVKQCTIIACSAFFVVLSISNVLCEVAGRKHIALSDFIISVLLLVLAGAIFLKYRWALRLVAALCVLLAVFLPGMLFNPHLAGDILADGGYVPPAEKILWRFILIEIFLLTVAFIIDPKNRKKEKKA